MIYSGEKIKWGSECVLMDDASETILALASEVQRLSSIDTRVKVKLGTQYGNDLAGNWFFLTPSDEYAELALEKHTGISKPFQQSKEDL